MRGLARLCAVLTLPASLGACFRYLPAPLDAVPANEDVRVHLSRVALARVPEEFPTGGSYLMGRIVGLSPVRRPGARAARFPDLVDSRYSPER